MSTRPRLEASVILPIDVGDQPTGDYVFVVEGLLGPRQAFSIDSWNVTEEHVTGYRRPTPLDATRAVIVVPVRAPWCIVRRDALVLSNVTESAKKQKVDNLAQAAFEKELYPPSPDGKDCPHPSLGYTPGPGVYA